MKTAKGAVKYKVLFWIVLCLCGLGYLILNAQRDNSFPTIPFEANWDVSKKDSSITRAFSVSSDRSYDFILAFRIRDSEKDLSKLRPLLTEIAGDGSIWRPGITIPIHIKVEMLEVNKIGQAATVLDETANARRPYNFGYRDINRRIASARLAPGRYTVAVATTEETSLPAWIETYLSVTYYPK